MCLRDLVLPYVHIYRMRGRCFNQQVHEKLSGLHITCVFIMFPYAIFPVVCTVGRSRCCEHSIPFCCPLLPCAKRRHVSHCQESMVPYQIKARLLLLFQFMPPRTNFARWCEFRVKATKDKPRLRVSGMPSYHAQQREQPWRNVTVWGGIDIMVHIAENMGHTRSTSRQSWSRCFSTIAILYSID